ncbi:MAG: DNA mismatch repair endonuclease MutL [Alkalibacterium gilvum]|uniref:DNA mismatch repair protein MutL n=1 Tax=Alkalibacterium gilvum TaxID=1130080 RepID=A0A1H6UTF9_9LACT|nr:MULTISPECIES: DNA mismatch repair endonuclease MutL [Alkalibacterium]MDN6293264.1 DNA mismatch repair endonuclease MutL [Alkalibacterium sp.]MDN6295000.1 DNA mismatch repair endonuclease MutL [Alkalibacterium sp.]MDN6398025.1 DNA mismatch repair endonuclease MutL [Alkalibacterium sp.]MDN6728715.1 DNA mismatch repair endonuclease MutL [Alkalibacterium sp.]SEI91345.1 DNA mismatch repair protein MutL [Alkalibacterium gilvum]
MTTKIQIMSKTLANQIAAGEVIERPASVVKELMENAIDAKSTRVEIFVEEAGLKSIQVIDDGEGISKEEVVSAFERHATSKLITDEELFRIRTLGFRGEALPSIASVSKITLESAEQDKAGTQVVLHGGEVIEQKASSSRQGVNIKVEELFYNTPARLKYVKTLQTELAHINDTVNRLALAHPEIAFKLVSDGNIMIKTAGNGEQKQAIAGVYGVNIAKKMCEVKETSFDFTVTGYVSLPDVTRSNNKYITVIINGRYIKNYALNKAIAEGFGSKLMVGRYPIAVINVTLDPQLLDVNVHPTKHQIRISNEKELGLLISSAISKRMDEEVRIPNALDNLNQRNKRSWKEPKEEQTRFDFQENTTRDTSNSVNKDKTVKEPTGFNKFVDESYNHYMNTNADSHNGNSNLYTSEMRHKEPILKTVEKENEKTKQIEQFPELDYIGQMHGTYLFAQNEEGLYIIDQHAAQERIKYEYFRETIDQTGTELQELLIPIVVEYPSNEAIIIRDNKDKLAEASVYLEDFGQNSFIIRQHPTWMLAGQVEGTIKEMIDFFLEKSTLTVNKFREATAIMMSCKRSIKANHYLSDEEARELLRQLRYTKNPYNCPHGRPVTVNFTTMDMEKMFKRIQDSH